MLLKRICAALAASVALCAPVSARVDNGTQSLIRTAEQYGATFVYNPDRCNGDFAGSYQGQTQVITLCYHGSPRANDYDTVRHEVWHFVQHCAGRRRGRRGLLPVSNHPQLRSQWIQDVLPNKEISRILAVYDPQDHALELEAFAAAAAYSANDMASILRQWCVRPR